MWGEVCLLSSLIVRGEAQLNAENPDFDRPYLISDYAFLRAKSVSLIYTSAMPRCALHFPSRMYNYPRKNTSILAFRDAGLSKTPVPLLKGLPPMPRGLPPTPEPNFRPAKPDELLGRCWIGVEKVPIEELIEALNCLCGGDGVPKDTERGDADVDGARRGEGRLLDGDALYRGGVMVSVKVVAMGVMSNVNMTICFVAYLFCQDLLNRAERV